jgi:hypothetical protein
MNLLRSQGWRTNIWILTGIAITSAGLASAVFGSAYASYFRIPFPYRDMAETMEFLDGNPVLWLGESFSRLHDMEHRPAFPACIWFADRVWSGSAGLLPLLISHACLAGASLLAVRSWAPQISVRNPLTWIPPTAALAATFSLINWYNLMWEKQLHVAMSLLFLALAAYFAGRCADVDNRPRKLALITNLGGSGLAAGIATFSFGYGLPAMPVIAVHGLFARWPWPRVLFCAVLSAILIGAYLYFLSLRNQGLSGLGDVSIDPIEATAYIAQLLSGAVVAREMHDLVGLRPGYGALTFSLTILGLYVFGASRIYLRSIRLGHLPTGPQSSALIITSSCVAIALMTCLSRPIETQGIVDRYYVVSTVFLLSLPGLFIPAERWRYVSRGRRAGVLVLSSMFVLWSILGHMSGYPKLLHRWHLSALAAIGADMDIFVFDENQLVGPSIHQWKSKTLGVWATHRERLKARGRYLPFEWRGENLQNVFTARGSGDCTGSINWIRPVPGYDGKYGFVGWALHSVTELENADWIIAVDPTDRIIGLGAPGRRSDHGREWFFEHDSSRLYELASNFGFAGYMAAQPGTRARFMSIKGNQVCQVGASRIPA